MKVSLTIVSNQGTPYLRYSVCPSRELFCPVKHWVWRFARVWSIFPWYALNWTAQQVPTTILMSEQAIHSLKNNLLMSWTTRAQKYVKPCSLDFVRWLGIPMTELALEINHSRTLRTSGCNFSSINFSRHFSQALINIVRRRSASLRW